MIKHIVLFELKEFESEEAKTHKLEDLKTALLALADKIDVLKSIEVGLNCNPKEDYDLALTTTFASMEDLRSYAIHPDHVKVGASIREVAESRACVDYEF